MEGEEEFWYELASHLHLPVQRCKRETTSREFVRWRIYLSKSFATHDKEDWRAASIVAAIRAGHSRSKIKLKDCLLDYDTSANKGRILNKEEASAASRAKWFVITGFEEDK